MQTRVLVVTESPHVLDPRETGPVTVQPRLMCVVRVCVLSVLTAGAAAAVNSGSSIW
jgi:hypothetical protein